MTRETSAGLGSDAFAAEAKNTGTGTGRTPEMKWKAPPSTNPAAAELTFSAADEARDVASRLRTYATAEGVVKSETDPGDAKVLSMRDSLQISQISGRDFLSAQEEYILSSIQLLITRHQWGPRLFNDTSATVAGSGEDGEFEHALAIVNSLRATQRLPYGGSVEARWIWDASENLRQSATGRYEQSSRLVLGGNIPRLRGAGDAAREDLIQSERDLVYAAREFERFRREYLVDIAEAYLRLLTTRASIGNEERRLDAVRDSARERAALVQAGRLQEFEKGQADNAVLSAEASLANLRERYILQLDQFKVRLGLPVKERITLQEDTLEIPEPEISLDEATELALQFRLDLQNQRDRLEDRRRGVANAKNNLLPDLDITGNVSIPTDPSEREGGVAFDPGELNYSAGVTLGLPLDRKEERLRLRAAIIGVERATRDFERSRDEVVISVRAALREVDLARFQLKLAEEQVKVNERRLVGQTLQPERVSTRDVLDANDDLLDSKNNRDEARTALRLSVLRYLLQTDQLRVKRDGTLEELPGLTR